MREESDGFWIWVRADEDPPYEVTGKYLFFSEDREQLVEIAPQEIRQHGFHEAN